MRIFSWFWFSLYNACFLSVPSLNALHLGDRTVNQGVYNKVDIQQITIGKVVHGENTCFHVPDIAADTRWLRSPYVGVVSFRVRKQMSYKASLSMQNVESVFSTSWCTERVALYGSTTVSDTFGDGTIENVFMIRSGYSSRIFDINSVPSPEPVPPPREWVSWNPCKQSHPSLSLRTTSRICTWTRPVSIPRQIKSPLKFTNISSDIYLHATCLRSRIMVCSFPQTFSWSLERGMLAIFTTQNMHFCHKTPTQNV